MNVYNFSPDNCDCSCGSDDELEFDCSCKCCLLRLIAPLPFAHYESLLKIEGETYPNETVKITVDGYPSFDITADANGRFSTPNPFDLDKGVHMVCAWSCPSNCRFCASFLLSGDSPVPVPEPTLETPECGSTIADPSPWISGHGEVGNTVRVCIDGYGCRTSEVDEFGMYYANFDVMFPDGTYEITVTQIDARGSESESVTCSFSIDTTHFEVIPIEARMGATFRTVDIDVSIAGTTGNATVYYLLVPPGAPAPTVDEIMNYSDAASLRNGTAAAGQFDVTVPTTLTTYTWSLTGLDKPGAPVGTTGVIDGYRYDVYIYVVSQGFNSGVLTFPEDGVMGMPFNTGLGTADNPFTIRELTQAELNRYPDLLEGNALNRPGVDETARQLENIERLITLYEETDGLYGLGDSMALNYLLVSDIDLDIYAAAYDGSGWEPIGDIDGWINHRKQTEHLFSGVLDGGGYTISNLSMTPTATDDYFVGYRGLFGGVEDGTIKNLKLDAVRVNAYTTSPGFAEIGSFISTARNPTLSNLTLTDASLLADCDTAPVYDPHMINIGGFSGAIFEDANVTNIIGEGITIRVPSEHALSLGGFVGYTDKFHGMQSYENIDLSSIDISGFSMIGGFAGYIVYGLNILRNVTINNITITAPGGDAGGLIGHVFVWTATGTQLFEDIDVKDILITSGIPYSNGRNVGGMIGRIDDYPYEWELPPNPNRRDVFGKRTDTAPLVQAVTPVTTVRRCSVKGGAINGYMYVGGLIGNFMAGSWGDFVTLCSTDITVNGGGYVGGLMGSCEYVDTDQSYSLCTVDVTSAWFGGLVGNTLQGSINNCYARGSASGSQYAGGLIGGMSKTRITNSYRWGDVVGTSTAGGISGYTQLGTVAFCLVLSGSITASMPHRIIGIQYGTEMIENFAVNTVTPVPPIHDPSTIDGGTITPSDIIIKINVLGWDTTTVWDTSTIPSLGYPTLRQNPET